MATEVVKIVDTGGTGDYSDLAAWEAGEQRDLVTADEIAIADCRCTTGAADTTAMTIDGWTTDDTRYIKIWTDPDQGYRHDGKWNTTKFRCAVTDAAYGFFKVREEYVWIDGIQISITHSSSQCRGIWVSASSAGLLKVSNCVFVGFSSAYPDIGLDSADSDVDLKCWNTVFDGVYTSILSASNNAYCYNVTIYGTGTSHSIREIGGTTTCINCISANVSYDFHGVTTVDHCASDTGVGTNAQTLDSTNNYENEFVDAANHDFHLVSTSVCVDNGTDLSSDPYLSFTDDIDGETRSAPWDIGADEYVAGGTIISSSAGVDYLTVTPNSNLNVLRQLSTQVAANTDTSISRLAIIRQALADISLITTTPDDVILNLATVISAIAQISAQIDTSSIVLSLLKSAIVNVAASSTTSSPELEKAISSISDIFVSTETPNNTILRNLIVTTAVVSNITITPDSVELEKIIASLSNVLPTTVTSDVVNLRKLIDSIADIDYTTSTSQVLLNLLKEVVSIASITTLTPDNVVLELTKIISASASILNSFSTSDVLLQLLRELIAQVDVDTITPDDVALFISGVLEAVANILAQTATSNITLKLIKELQSSINVETTTPSVILSLILSLSSAIEAVLTTPDDISLLNIKIGNASIVTTTEAADVALRLLKAVSAEIAVGNITSEAMLKTLIENVADVDIATLTSAISLVTEGFGLLLDTAIESLTTSRNLSSLTTVRKIESI